MINHVIFEGYLVKQWQYQERQYLRLAGHRPQADGSALVQSDYVTIQLDPLVQVDPGLQVGARLIVSGKVWGRDIVETLGRVLQKSDLSVDLPTALENMVVRRPTVQILASQVEVAGKERRNRPAARRERVAAKPTQKVNRALDTLIAGELATKPVVPLSPGDDLASLITDTTD